ncbi:MAG: metallophosphoesterase [Candidatus Lokiarchaeota archaeon]|nr:metallophosphoesterase [Candidatus Lokiarchaeota archaeon]
MIERTYLKELINNPHLLSELEFGNISRILQTVKNLFEEENLLLDLNLNNKNREIYVIGDIHGDLNTLLKIIKIVKEKNPERVIFLGDIVDRGPKQLECFLTVLILKILHPQKYYLLKGNHETLEINQMYGFVQDFKSRFKDFEKFNEILMIYNVLPICALVNNSILCLHGGIPQDVEILDKLKNIKTKELDIFINTLSQDLTQIMWNDPKSNLQGFSESFRGPGIKFFGEDVFETFLKKNNLKFVIRSHELFPEGYRWFFHRRLLSIFSSANYRGLNPAYYAVINNDELFPQILNLE